MQLVSNNDDHGQQKRPSVSVKDVRHAIADAIEEKMNSMGIKVLEKEVFHKPGFVDGYIDLLSENGRKCTVTILFDRDPPDHF